MAPMENLPDVVDDSDKFLPSGSEREAHATMLNLESLFQVNDRMEDESATHHEGLSTKNQMCSICGSSACDTWLVCNVHSRTPFSARFQIHLDIGILERRSLCQSI